MRALRVVASMVLGVGCILVSSRSVQAQPCSTSDGGITCNSPNAACSPPAGGTCQQGMRCVCLPPSTAASKCDAAISKAAGKKVACKCGVIAKAQAKGVSPDPNKLAACGTKFSAACSKAKSAGGCVAHTHSCTSKENDADESVVQDCLASPSGAFLDD